MESTNLTDKKLPVITSSMTLSFYQQEEGELTKMRVDLGEVNELIQCLLTCYRWIKWAVFLTSSVHTQAVTAKMFKEGMRIEAIHVKKWVNLVGFYFYIAFTSESSFSRELMRRKSTKHHDFLIEWRLQSQQRQNEPVRTQKKQTYWSAERRNRPSDTCVSFLLID